jgi:hypothetical protein
MTEQPTAKLEDLPVNPYIEWMHEQWQKDKEHLWPKAPLKPRAFEQRLGEGYLTVTDSSLIFESGQGDMIGFDLANLRVVRLVDRDSFEVLYSVQGEVKKASFRVVVTSAKSGKEIPTEMQKGSALTIVMTGAIVARFLSDHSGAQIEGIKKLTDQEIDSKLKRVQELIDLFPSQKELDDEEAADNVDWEHSLHMRTHDAIDELNLKIFPELAEKCAFGSISPEQRLRVIAMMAKRFQRHYDLKHLPSAEDDPSRNPEWFKEDVEMYLADESLLGNNLSY